MEWEKRTIKKDVRRILLDQLSFDRPITYLGLPAGQALFEIELSKKFDITDMYLFERDPKVMESLEQECAVGELASISTTCLQTDVDMWIEGASPFIKSFNFDFAWLDYCGPLTPLRLDSLKTLISNMPLDGILAATFMIGREKQSTKELLKLISDSDSELEDLPMTHIKRVRLILDSLSDLDFKFDVFVQPYADNVPMLLIVFKKVIKTVSGLKFLRKTFVDIQPYLKNAEQPKRVSMFRDITINGVQYSSTKDAADALGLSTDSIRYRLKSSKHPHFSMCEL